MTESTPNNGKQVTETPDVSPVRNVDVAYEQRDVSVRGVVTFAVALTIVIVVAFAAMILLFRALDSRARSSEAPPPPMALGEQEKLPPQPRLQGARGDVIEGRDLELKPPQEELKVVQEEWQKVLKDGPVDKNGNHYGLPIEKAKDEILKRRLPARKQ